MRLFLIRHAPPLNDGCLAGRRDIDADCADRGAFDRMRAALPAGAAHWASPARRCRQTAAALGLTPQVFAALWEQDYGRWEGLPFAQLPDLGALPPPDLAAHRPEGGESFNDMARRAQAQIVQAGGGDTVIVAHAGTVRAALSLVVGPAALSFSVAPLSLTVMRRAGDDWAIEQVNARP